MSMHFRDTTLGDTERVLPSDATMAAMLALAKTALDKTSFAQVLRGE